MEVKWKAALMPQNGEQAPRQGYLPLTRMDGRDVHGSSTWHHSRIHVRLHHEPPWIKTHGRQVLRVGLHWLVKRPVSGGRHGTAGRLSRDRRGKCALLLLLLPLLLFHLLLERQGPAAWDCAPCDTFTCTQQAIVSENRFWLLHGKDFKRHLTVRGGKTTEQRIKYDILT